MKNFIDSLLALARADAGIEVLHIEPLEANRLALQLGERWKTAMRLALLEFEVEVSREPSLVLGDANALQRMLTIMLDNAVRYTSPGGSVSLRVAREGGRIIFTIRDTGIGIATEHQSRIFDRFYRIDNTRTGGPSRGSGLGLALAQWIAEKHGTSISLESTIGKGSSFAFGLGYAGTSQANFDAAGRSIGSNIRELANT